MLDHWASHTKIGAKLEGFASKYLAKRFRPNQITVAAFCIGLGSAGFIILNVYLVMAEILIPAAVTCMIVSFTLDTFDGALARVQGPTTFGGILDIFCDRAVEVSILLALAFSDFTVLAWPTLLSLSAIVLCITIFLLVGGAVKAEELAETQKVLYYQKGLMERGETFLFLLAMVLLPWVRFWLLWIFAILVFITAFQRLWIAAKLFSNK